MASLADQLKQLQIPGKRNLQTSPDRVSILFDKKTASTLDNDAIFNIGVSGFEQMKTVDPIFSEYGDAFFSKASLQVHRSMLEKSYEKKLRKKISEFLILLSPYLQLQNAKKCLEWLIRRFEIHVFDKDSLLQCIMPYHETQLFARILQIVSVEKIGSVWDHLLPKLKQGNSVNTNTLVNHCFENKSLLLFMCEMVEKASKLMEKSPRSGLQLVFSFYAQLISGVANRITQLTEEKLVVFIPIIENGLVSGVKDYVCATYILVTILLSKGQLKEKVRQKLLVKVVKSMDVGWYDYGFLCMISIYGAATLSSKLVEPLLALDLDALTNSLERLNQKYEIEIFVGHLLSVVCENINKVDSVDEACNLITSFFETFNFKESQMKSMVSCLIDHFVNLEDSNVALVNVLKDVASRFSTIYDPCMNLKFSENTDDSTRVDRLKQLAQACFSKNKVQILGDTDLPLILCLNHPEKEFRCLAVKQLFSTFKSGVYDYDDSFFKESVLARLQDDDAEVVNTVLKNPKSLTKILSIEDIKPIIEKLSVRTDCNFNMNFLYLKVVKSLEDPNSDLQKEFFFSILGQIFLGVSSKKFYKMVDFFQSDDVETNNPVFSGVKEALVKHKDKDTESSAVETYNLLVEKIASKIDWNFLLIMVKYCESLPQNHILQFVTGLIILENLWSMSFSVSQIMSLNLERFKIRNLDPDTIQMFVECESPKQAKSYLFKKMYASMKKNDTFSGQLIGTALAFIIKFILPKLQGTDVNSREMLFKLIVPTATSVEKKKYRKYDRETKEKLKPELTAEIQLYQTLLKEYLHINFEVGIDTNDLLVDLTVKLLLMEESDVTKETMKLAVDLVTISKLLALNSGNGITDKVIALHLVLLSFPNKTIRKAAVGNIEDFVHGECDQWKFILGFIKEKSEQVVLDQTVIGRLFSKKREHRFSVWNSVLEGKEIADFLNWPQEDLATSLVLAIALCFRLLASKLNPKVESRRKSDFDVVQKKGNKLEKQKNDSLNHFKKAMKSFPLVLRMRVLELAQNVQLGEDCVQDIDNVKVDEDKPRSSVKFYGYVLERICRLDNITNENVALINQCLKCDMQEFSLLAISKLCILFPKLDTDNQQLSVLRCVLHVVNNSSYAIATKARSVLKELKIDSQHVGLLFNEACQEIDKILGKNKTTEQIEVETKEELKECVDAIDELLVALSDRKVLDDPNDLVTAVFAVLERCCKIQDESIEFTKQLCLSLLCNVTNEGIAKLSFHRFKVDLLLECLRTSDNIQTKESCLQAISSAAVLYPTHVLHNVMQIFTFMGGSLLKIDNEHSFNIIKQTINTIIPILLEKNSHPRKRSSTATLDEIVIFILQTFVDSCPHCPEHRRDFILSNLLEALGSEHLHKAMLLLIKKITDASKEKSDISMQETSAQEQAEYAPITLDFCFYFFSLFDVRDQLIALQQMITYMMTIPLTIEHKQKKKQKAQNEFIDFQGEGEKQMRLFTYSVMSFLMLVLKSDNLRNSYHGDGIKRPHDTQQLTNCYLGLSEVIIRYADKVEKEIEETVEGSITCKYGKKLFEKICKMMEVTFMQIPLISFYTLVNGLLQKDLLILRTKALQLLAGRMENNASNLNEEEELTLMQVLSTIKAQLKKDKLKDAGYTQLLLFSVKVLVPSLSRNHSHSFSDLIPFATSIFSNDGADAMVSINAMLLVAEICSLMGVQVLSELESFVTPVLSKINENDIGSYKKDPLLLTCCLTSLHKVFASVASFMSPYIVPIIQKIAICDVVQSSNETLKSVLAEFKRNVGEMTKPRIMLPSVEKFIDSVGNADMLHGTLEIFMLNLEKMSATDVNVTYNEKIVVIFEKLLDKQCVANSPEIQTKVITSFCKLVLRMTEKSLRLVYIELYYWATSRQENQINERLLSFFRLSVAMGNTLQGLFLLFTSQLMEKSAELLEMYVYGIPENDSKPDISLHRNLVTSVLDCLAAIFRYDSHGYMNRERFQLVIKPLIDQMECRLFDGVEGVEGGYSDLISNHLLPVIVHLASAVNDSFCWKTLNHLVLSKTKSSNAKVRYAALDVTGKIYDKLGESFMVLVPETIPYLSEVLEDESFEVESKCREVIQQIEQITGESLHKYF